MFDIGFWELMVIAVVALLVIGPQRLPAVARTVGLWVGRGKRLVNSVKSDIEQEMRAEELKRILKEQQAKNPLHEVIEETRSDLEAIEKGTAEAVRGAKSSDKKNDGDRSAV
jgi:sec-independent protein translocase protein TatB